VKGQENSHKSQGFVRKSVPKKTEAKKSGDRPARSDNWKKRTRGFEKYTIGKEEKGLLRTGLKKKRGSKSSALAYGRNDCPGKRKRDPGSTKLSITVPAWWDNESKLEKGWVRKWTKWKSIKKTQSKQIARG